MPLIPQLAANLTKMAKAAQAPLWVGPCGEGPNGGVTQSMLARYLGCKERFRVKFVLGLSPSEQWNHKMGYGNMWHVCEESLAGEANPIDGDEEWRTCLHSHTQKQLAKYPFAREDIQKWYNVCLVQFPEYVKYWAEHADVKHRIPLMQEEMFDIVYELPSGRKVRLRGKFDSVDIIKDPNVPIGVYLQENKTKSDVDELQVQRQLRFDLQSFLYLTALQRIETVGYESDGHYASCEPPHPILGVRYNVVRRPLSGGTGSISPHKEKCTKPKYGTGKNAGKLLHPGKIIPAETDAEFYERLRRDYLAANPTYWFFRVRAEINEQEINTFQQQCLNPVLENLCDDYEWWSCCSANKISPFDVDRKDALCRQATFPQHHPRHFRMPFGVYNPLQEGGFTEYDSFLESGNRAGLVTTKLFPELQGEDE